MATKAAQPLKRPASTQLKSLSKRPNVGTSTFVYRKETTDTQSRIPLGKGVAVLDNDNVNDILDDIKALGGNEQDLQLIGDLSDTDSEVLGDGNAIRDQEFDRELAAFANTLFPDYNLSHPGGIADTKQDEAVKKNLVRSRDSKLDQAPSKIGLVFPPRIDWHAAIELDLYANTIALDEANCLALKRRAVSLLDAEADRYATAASSSSSSKKFLSAIMTDGTMSDKVSALTLAIQESPVHNVKAFETLLSLASKRNRTQSITSLEAIVDLLGPGSLLPPDRRLRPFHAQPFFGATSMPSDSIIRKGNTLLNSIPDICLIYAAYEDCLKEACFRVVQLLEVLCLDEIEYSRLKGLDLVASLLTTKPEQEANLLRLLVSKLGDKERRVSSRASYLILQLQNSHPRMKSVILKCIEKELILDPSRGFHSKYYAVNTLNQTILNSKAPEVAEALLSIYFALFADILKTNQLGFGGTEPNRRSHISRSKPRSGGLPVVKDKGAASTEIVDKLVSAILTGINRAIPFVSVENSMLASHMDVLFRVAHSANFNTNIQALLLILQLTSVVHSATDRFYRTLYESLLDPRLAASSKHTLYLNLLLRSIQSDLNIRRVKAFVKRMLQIATIHNVPFTCGLMYIVSQVRLSCSTFEALLDQPEENEGTQSMYDGRKRDPGHSNAHQSCLWEIEPFLTHFHPAVVAASSRLVSRSEVTIKPDLDHHTLIRFLDKFAFRAPKTSDSSRGASIMQPRTNAHGQALDGRLNGSRAITMSAVNSPSFWNRKVEDVAVEDVFFHRYFSETPYQRKISGAAERTTTQNISLDETDDEAEEEIWKALVSKQHDTDGEDMSNFGESPDYNSHNSEDDDDQMDYDYDPEDQTSDDVLADIDQASFSSGESVKDGAEPQHLKGYMDWHSSTKVRRSFKSLPTFASAEDYEMLLDG